MKLRTLIILTPGFPENEADSTCLPPQQIFVKALRAVQPELNIVVLTFQYPFFTGEYQWHGIRVVSFGHPGNSRIIRRFAGLRVWMVLRRLLREFHIVGMLSFWLGKCAYIGSRFAKRHSLIHYTWLLGQDARAGNKYFSKARPTGKSLIALSDFLVREFTKNYGITPAQVIPVGIDVTLFKENNIPLAGQIPNSQFPIPNFSLAGASRAIDILGAGSLIPLKQYDVFVQVIGMLKASFPHIKAVICGDGPEKKRLKEMVSALGLTNNISFAGRLPHQEVLALMQRSRAFMHTSGYEGFGAVCLEALYAGAPVVSFVKPMDQEIENWHIAADITAMANHLKKILANKEVSAQRVLPYTIEGNAKAMLRLFDQSEAATRRIFPAMASKERVVVK